MVYIYKVKTFSFFQNSDCPIRLRYSHVKFLEKENCDFLDADNIFCSTVEYTCPVNKHTFSFIYTKKNFDIKIMWDNGNRNNSISDLVRFQRVCIYDVFLSKRSFIFLLCWHIRWKETWCKRPLINLFFKFCILEKQE